LLSGHGWRWSLLIFIAGVAIGRIRAPSRVAISGIPSESPARFHQPPMSDLSRGRAAIRAGKAYQPHALSTQCGANLASDWSAGNHRNLLFIVRTVRRDCVTATDCGLDTPVAPVMQAIRRL
jgi:hypothetical protein